MTDTEQEPLVLVVEDEPQMRRFLRAGQLDPRPVITHRFPLESIAEAIQVIKDGQAGKVILEIGA